MDMFEKASRLKIRFASRRGALVVDDLWDLPLTELDAIYKRLNAQAKQAKEESLLDVRSDEDKILDVSIEIVKHVVSEKLAENAVRLTESANRAKKAKLLEILESKQNAALLDLPEDKLQEMIESL